MDPLAWVDDELSKLREAGLFTAIRTIESPQGAWLQVDGRHVLNFCSNNYLGLANHPRLVEAAKSAIDRFGVGPAAVRTIAGTMSLHLELERRLAEFKGVAAAITFQGGFNANLAVIPAVVGRGDVIYSDQLNHASIIDGCRLSRADIKAYPHADVEGLERVIEENQANYARSIVITDGVFSMDGDIAPLPDIVAVAKRHGCVTMVDDAHGEGVLGRGGRGIVDHFGLHGQVDLEVGTMSKAFGCVGGVVAGDARVIDWLRQRGRPFLFSSASTPADVAACLAAVELLDESTELVERLWSNARYLQSRLRGLEFDTGLTQTPITPVMLGEAPLAQAFGRRLYELDVFATPIAFPTVPQGAARIRVMPSAAHSMADLDVGIAAFETVGRELGVI